MNWGWEDEAEVSENELNISETKEDEGISNTETDEELSENEPENSLDIYVKPLEESLDSEGNKDETNEINSENWFETIGEEDSGSSIDSVIDSYFEDDLEEDYFNFDKVNKDKKERKSNLSDEYLYRNKGKELDAEDISIFHKNTQVSKGIKGKGLNDRIKDLSTETLDSLQEEALDKVYKDKVLNKQSDEVYITDGGLSVSDLIRHKRKSKDSQIRSKINNKKVEEIKENLDNPLYLRSLNKTQESIGDKMRRYGISPGSKESTGKKLSKSDSKGRYINKLRSGSGYSNLLKTLGMSGEELMEVLSKDNRLLNKSEKERLLNLGIDGSVYSSTLRNSNGNQIRGAKRSRLTESDYELLDFINRFEYSGLSTIGIGLGKSIEQVSSQVDKLMKMGCIIEQQILGTKYVYYISPAGYTILTGEMMAKPLSKVKEGSISNKAITNYVGALLYSGKQNILRDEGYGENRLLRGKLHKGETVIPERVYKSSIGSMVGSSFTGGIPKGSKRNQIGYTNANKLWREWNSTGKTSGALSPDEIEGNEFLYVLYPQNIRDVNSVIPDLVVKRSRAEDGSPENIAIEIERERRKVEYYINRLRAYQQDKRIYKKVVYIVNEKLVAKRIMEAKEHLGFDRVELVPLIDEEGSVMDPIKDVWRLI